MKNLSYLIDIIFISISGSFLLNKIQTILSFLIVLISFLLVILKLVLEYKKFKKFNNKLKNDKNNE